MAEQGSIFRTEQADSGARANDALAAIARAEKAANTVGRAALAGAGRLVSGPAGLGETAPDLSLLGDVNLHVQIELGRTRMYVEDVLRLNPGSVVELDRAAGDPVDILVNDQPIARGEVIVLNDHFCVRVTEIIDPGQDNANSHGE